MARRRIKHRPRIIQHDGTKTRRMPKFYLLFLSLSLFLGEAPALMTNGVYLLTTQSYKNTRINDMGTWTLFTHVTVVGESIKILKECMLVCQYYPGCKAFIHKPDLGMCMMTSYDICANPEVHMWESIGEYIYEVVNGSSNPMENRACFDKCLTANNNDCDKCGRPGCHGLSCQDCKSFCWELQPLTQGFSRRKVYDTSTIIRSMFCRDEWLLIWEKNFQWHKSFDGLNLKLRVMVFSNGRVAYADFDSFSYTGTTITVGNFEGGNATNSWGAPFTDRALIVPAFSNCMPFFYAADTPCNVNELPDYETQTASNMTLIQGYNWHINDSSMDMHRKYRIELLVKPI